MDNYEVKYNAALSRAKKELQACGSQDCDAARQIFRLFPELMESEDEKIRKGLIEYLKADMEYNPSQHESFYEESISWLEKQGEQKSNDVEPKFHMGNWVVSNKDGKVYTVGTTYCITGDNICLHGIDRNHKWVNRDDLDKEYHLWTIHDAKDGDVLVCDINKAEIGGDVEKLPNITSTICIYQNVVKDKDYIHSYCSLYDGSSLVTQNRMYYNMFVYNIHPATKEQRDLLFQKMEEAGYEWDGEKKELKKIEPKKLDPDKVIAWLVANIIDFEKYVRLFKKDFGL